MIQVTMTFNGHATITLTSEKQSDIILLNAAFTDKTVKAIHPVDGGFEIVLEEHKNADKE